MLKLKIVVKREAGVDARTAGRVVRWSDIVDDALSRVANFQSTDENKAEY